MDIQTYQIFLSHYAFEDEVAKCLKAFIERRFPRVVRVFVASHERDLKAGDKWEESIWNELAITHAAFLLLSADSMSRPWINLEAGAAEVRKIPLVPLLHRGLKTNELVPPFSRHQCFSLSEQGDINKLIKFIAAESGMQAPRGLSGAKEFVERIASCDKEIERKVIDENRPGARSLVRFYLYSKSAIQHKLNVDEAGKIPLSSFRKPEIFDVYEALKKGQPDTTLINLDEFWTRELAQVGRLEEVTLLSLEQGFLPELTKSCEFDGKHWAVPHFVDFSYYACRTKGTDGLRAILSELREAEDVTGHLQDMRRIAKSDNLLLYDFRTPDTVASVLLEFIKAFGSGIESLVSPERTLTPRNIRAIKILRGMIGVRPTSEEFSPGDPLNFDNECDHVPFVRDWYTRFSDMPRTRNTHDAMFDFPIPGTLGGWHVGMLAPSPSKKDGQDSLRKLLTKENQLRRFSHGAGVPTLVELYRNDNSIRADDPITKWSLAQIREYLQALIRRSDIPSYPALRDRLIDLGYKVLRAPLKDTERLAKEWRL